MSSRGPALLLLVEVVAAVAVAVAAVAAGMEGTHWQWMSDEIEHLRHQKRMSSRRVSENLAASTVALALDKARAPGVEHVDVCLDKLDGKHRSAAVGRAHGHPFHARATRVQWLGVDRMAVESWDRLGRDPNFSIE